MSGVSTSDTKPAYVFDNRGPTAERLLGCLSGVLDNDSVGLLSSTLELLGDGQRCLELGAGNGSIATWLAGKGHDVVALDVAPQHVRVPAGVPVVALDVREELPPGPFDLIHARLLLAHLPQRNDVLRRCVELLKPGGALVLEEWGAIGQSRVLSATADHAADLLWRYGETLMALLAAMGNDGMWCVRAHQAMVDSGLVDVRTSTRARSWHTDSPGCELPTVVSTQLHEQLVAHGMDGGDLVRLRTVLEDPATVVMGNLTWAHVGWKAGQA